MKVAAAREGWRLFLWPADSPSPRRFVNHWRPRLCAGSHSLVARTCKPSFVGCGRIQAGSRDVDNTLSPMHVRAASQRCPSLQASPPGRTDHVCRRWRVNQMPIFRRLPEESNNPHGNLFTGLTPPVCCSRNGEKRAYLRISRIGGGLGTIAIRMIVGSGKPGQPGSGSPFVSAGLSVG